MTDEKTTLADRVRVALREGRPAPGLIAGPVAPPPDQAPGETGQPRSAHPPPAAPRSVVHAAVASGQCLLLDVSGSMAEPVEPGRTKWNALSALLPQFAGVRRFAFSHRCREVGQSLPQPDGGTDMAQAFRTVKAAGVRHVVLITDGLPQDEDDAIQAARGLRIDILYVGPPPEPPFLARLARTTGGKAQTASLRTSAAPRIAAKVKALFALPPGPTRAEK